MLTPVQTLIQSGSKIWLDSVEPSLVAVNRQRGLTGATSNPLIIADVLGSGKFDNRLAALFDKGLDDVAVAWAMTDQLVSDAQAVFAPVWRETRGNDGYVSFELDPLLEDPALGPPHAQRVQRYIELGKKWSAGQTNRMIKVPATPAGLEAVEELAAAGVTLNVTLIFTMEQWEKASANIWKGAQRRKSLDGFKSVYSIFVSRIDAYTAKQVPTLSPQAQGRVGLVNAKRIWMANRDFWVGKKLKLQQELIFASTGTKNPGDPKDKYVEALAGADIQTNPPDTNDAVEAMGKTYKRAVEVMPARDVLEEIDAKVDFARMYDALMSEGIQKFADPFKKLLAQIKQKRAAWVK